MNTTIMVIAIVAGPILAVQAQKLIERLTQRRQAKEVLFKTLMSTRGATLLPAHVQALNMIDIEFHGKRKKNKKVVDAWRLYLDQLYSSPQDRKAADYKTKLEAWTSKNNDMLDNMLFEMATSLKYNFDKVLLKRGAYFPTGYGEAELDHLTIRMGLVDLFLGLKYIPIRVVEPPLTEAVEPSQKKV